MTLRISGSIPIRVCRSWWYRWLQQPTLQQPYLAQKRKLRLLTNRLLIISLHSFGTPPFHFYALARNIRFADLPVAGQAKAKSVN